MPKQKAIKQGFIILSCFVLGIIIVSKLESPKLQALVNLRSIKEIENQIAIEKESIKAIEKQIGEVENEIQKKSTLSEEDNKEELAKKLNEKKALAGYYKIKGEGIKLQVGDSTRQLKEWENPNNLVVHDQDILMLINDLKTAGAEVLCINGERLISSSEIKCNGPTITINEKTFGQPFVITAIGNKNTLSSGILAQDSYGYLLKEVYGLRLDISLEEEVTILAYSGEYDYKFREDKK